MMQRWHQKLCHCSFVHY